MPEEAIADWKRSMAGKEREAIKQVRRYTGSDARADFFLVPCFSPVYLNAAKKNVEEYKDLERELTLRRLAFAEKVPGHFAAILKLRDSDLAGVRKRQKGNHFVVVPAPVISGVCAANKTKSVSTIRGGLKRVIDDLKYEGR